MMKIFLVGGILNFLKFFDILNFLKYLKNVLIFFLILEICVKKEQIWFKKTIMPKKCRISGAGSPKIRETRSRTNY